MKYRVFDFLQCPNCKSTLELHVFKERKVSYNETEKFSSNGLCPPDCKNPDPDITKTDKAEGHCLSCYETEIEEGLLTCDCGKTFPVVKNVPRFLPDAFEQHPEFTNKYCDEIRKSMDSISEQDKENFNKMFKKTQGMFATQWRKWGRSERIFGFTDDEAKEWFLTDLTSKNIDADYFKGKTVLEVGCGHGRFALILSDICGEYIAIDLGEGVDLAHEITQDRPNVHVIQANALSHPLKDGKFDYVWSHGVLHHTPSTRGAFKAISMLPKKRTGRIYIWVYHKGGFIWEYGNRLVRSITTRLPSSVMHVIAYSLVPLLYLIPAYNKRVNLNNMSWSECALSTHDWLSPKYQWHHSNEEVKSWFEQEGYTDIEKTSANGVGITGVRK